MWLSSFKIPLNEFCQNPSRNTGDLFQPTVIHHISPPWNNKRPRGGHAAQPACVNTVFLHVQSSVSHNINLPLSVLLEIHLQLLGPSCFATTGVTTHHDQRHNYWELSHELVNMARGGETACWTFHPDMVATNSPHGDQQGAPQSWWWKGILELLSEINSINRN